MVFSSILFIFRFLPVALILYYFSPYKIKNLILLFVSLTFYSWGEPRYILIMFISIGVDYFASRSIEKYRDHLFIPKCFLALSLFSNLGLLMFFKYLDFFIININKFSGTELTPMYFTLPLGISFYTFQTLSYTLDVYKGKAKAEKNIIDFGAYVCLFPQLIAGPIVKYVDIQKELKNKHIHLEQIEEGIKLFIMGLGSKVLIANNIGSLWDEVVYIGFENISTPLAWLGILGFSLQIYFDFSGYSLMAIGLGKILGFNFPQNFNFPYMSKSITEFWRRWHMTLGSWFKEYVYIPLGGNRKGALRQYVNLFIVWFLTGFWHGASWNFALWGLYFFVLIVLEKIILLKYLKKSKLLSRIYFLLAILIGWVIFAISDIHQIKLYFTKMFIYSSGIDWIYYLRNYLVTIIFGVLLSTPLIKNIYEKYQYKKIWIVFGLMVVFMLSVAYLVDSSYNPFLYFRF